MKSSECAFEDALKEAIDDDAEHDARVSRDDLVESESMQDRSVVSTRSKHRRGRRWWDEKS